MVDTTNPYATPTASLTTPVVGPAPRRSAWALLRYFPVIYGGLGALVCWLEEAGTTTFNVATLIHVALLARATIPWTVVVPHVVRILGWTLGGIMATVATRDWYRCRWKRASLLTAGWIGLAVLVESLFRVLTWG